MKKAIGLMLACVLVVFALSGCQNQSEKTFEALGVTVDGEKTVDLMMNQEEVRKEMEQEPDDVTDSENMLSDRWSSDVSLSVDYQTEDPNSVSAIFVLSGSKGKAITSFGIGLGDSEDSLKEKLGDLCAVNNSDDGETSYLYAFRYQDGKYEIVDSNKTIGELTGDSEDVGLYSVTFNCKDDEVVSFYMTDVLR